MSLASELIQIVEQAGGRFQIDGDRLGIFPKEAAAPVLEQLRQHKAELIAELSRRTAMPAGVRIIRWEPKDAPVKLSESSTVTDTEKFIGTTLAQLDAKLNGKSWQAGNWPLSVLIDRLATCGCVVKLTDPRRALQ
jgi:hypothetical protein